MAHSDDLVNSYLLRPYFVPGMVPRAGDKSDFD